MSITDAGAETLARRWLTGRSIHPTAGPLSLAAIECRSKNIIMSDEYAQATPEQKLNIATYFVMSAPVGEVDEVVAGQSATAGRERMQAHATSARDNRHRTRPPVAGRMERGGVVHAACWYSRCVLAPLTTPLHSTRPLRRCGICCRRLSPSIRRCCRCRSASSHPDVKKLVADDAVLNDEALSNIMRDYNTEHMTAAPLPGTNRQRAERARLARIGAVPERNAK